MDAPPLPPASAARVREARGPKAPTDPLRPIAVWDEDEVVAANATTRSRVVLLAGAECTFSCTMCDLWKHTLPGPTPPGALPQQITAALAHGAPATPPPWIKLYNASNFFAPRSVPTDDLPAIARLVASHQRVIVENHPRLCDHRVAAFRDQLHGTLEVAMGLETVHPEILAWLGKEMTTADFAAACSRLARDHVDVRAFVLVGLPGLDERESLDWAIQAVRFARDQGVRHLTLIPTRPGNGWLDQLAADGLFDVPSLGLLEEVIDGALAEAAPMIVTADTWDLGRLAGQCALCSPARHARLHAINRAQRALPRAGHACACAAHAMPKGARR
jgi:radical SAM enzyme (TIGR01210 family)